MGKIAAATFEGDSGRKYSFEVYSLDTAFKDVGAVHVFTKRTVNSSGNSTHEFLYVGETGELGSRITNHEKWPCVESYNGNCICVHLDESRTSRLRKETDLRRGSDPPCND